ncbi:hypothetical protein bcere0028_14940 [Bacillus cereus AH1271]|nr:hypothetical protein bcere0028_14940 [Bacillus cereus AH1271]
MVFFTIFIFSHEQIAKYVTISSHIPSQTYNQNDHTGVCLITKETGSFSIKKHTVYSSP